MTKGQIAVFAAAVSATVASVPVEAAAWRWSLSGEGVSASGTLTTTDAPNDKGFVQITSIAGSRNGIVVTGLQPAGTAVPGNDGYPVDDLLRVRGSQLTGQGFGFALANGTYSNPYYADFQSPPAYYEFFSFPPSNAAGHTERPVVFFAAPVPEPATWSLLIAGFGLVGAALRRRTSAERAVRA